MKSSDKWFWITYGMFCLSAAVMLKFTGMVDVSKVGTVESGILTGALLLCGVFLRLWFTRNPDEIKRRFKIDD